MTDHWLTSFRLPVTPEQFRLLPRNPAFRYELIVGEVWISPRPRYYHAQLDLSEVDCSDAADVAVRPLADSDWDRLPDLFHRSFSHHQPYTGLSPDEKLSAAVAAIALTRTGGDGPLIHRACFVAHEDNRLLGAALVTILPPGDPEEFDTYAWGGTPPLDVIDRCDGWPHLTWILVDQSEARLGIGTTLLAAVARELLALGFNDLLSTFLLGNDVSAMWHWRRGFRLLSYPGSMRRWRIPQTD